VVAVATIRFSMVVNDRSALRSFGSSIDALMVKEI
jgi:hypothetical protein